MAIKASAIITLSFMVDVKATYRYYKLQASTESAPSIPTSAIPTGWTDTEPTYTEGSTNTLYIVDKTVFTNDTFLYSAVSKSTSYEAAKAAYNKAVNANDKVDNMQIGGRNLFLNTGVEISNNGYFLCEYKPANGPLISGETYTATICITPANNVSNYSLYFSYGYINVATFRVNGTSKQIISSTFVMSYSNGKDPSVDINYANAQIYRFPNNGTVTQNSTIHWFKIEKGNKATDWTPAPEDVDAAIKSKVSTVDVEYYLSTSSTSLSGGSWVTTAPEWVNGKYMWSRTKITNGSGNITYKPSQNGTCIAGATGATGKSVSSITEEYYLSTSKTSQTGGSWSTTAPTWSSGKYIWTRSKIVYTNPSSTAYTTPICDSSWEAVNEVQVGGRNLARKGCIKRYGTNGYTTVNDDNFITNGGFTFSRTAVPNEGPMIDNGMRIIKGTNYVTSFKIKFNTRDINIIYIYNGYSHINTKVYIDDVHKGAFGASISFPTDLKEHKVTLYYTANVDASPPITDTSAIHTILQPNKLSTEAYTATVTNFKTEIGNKPTDWTPAPEDVDSELDNIRTTYTKSVDLKRTNESIQMNFNTIQQTIENNQNVVTNKFNTMSKYIRFENGNIILGQQGNQITCTISNNRISFLQGADEVAYLSDNKLYIKKSEITNQLQIGNFSFIAKGDGGLRISKTK